MFKSSCDQTSIQFARVHALTKNEIEFRRGSREFQSVHVTMAQEKKSEKIQNYKECVMIAFYTINIHDALKEGGVQKMRSENKFLALKPYDGGGNVAARTSNNFIEKR